MAPIESISRTAKGKANEAEEAGAFCRAVTLGNGTVLSMTLKAIMELGVLDIMAAEGPGSLLSPEEIASQIQTTNPDAPEVLDRMLRFLASDDVVKCELVAGEDGKTRRRYGLGPVGKFFTDDDDGMSLAPLMILHHCKVSKDIFSSLKYAVLEGTTPFSKATGATLFEYHNKDTWYTEVFNKTMFNLTTMLVKKILEKYKGFESLKKLVDVGGGLGATLGLILSKYPHIKGINFDLPFLISQAPAVPGVEHIGGNMFESVPSGDAIFMKWILHDWSDENCVKILKNCWKALPDSGKMIIVEVVVPEKPEDSDEAKHSLMTDILMLACCVGGKERTEKEYECLAKESTKRGTNGPNGCS
ncbi:hypothetical protein J5N97_024045 [Dioscorea zingiberensis]|uniref:Caffeic acid O-methyltransferase n=1 Tax=Dioscorea zingiberensis TaxID=325984 RepID=A0A9D5H8H7_9LILI|nr:hypothetical protein J5N97_024045 [Dioscorea zingiberensis]